MGTRIVTTILALAIAPCFAQSNLLQITSPASGTIVNPGQVVIISVSGDPSVSNIGIEAQDPLGFTNTTSGQPLQFQLSIPSTTTMGSYDVSAVGSAADGSLVVSPPISLQVDTPNTQFTILTEPSVLRFSAPGETIPLHAIGTFPDRSQLDMTHSAQMSYGSGNPQVATVDGQGIVTAVAPGSTVIVVCNTMGQVSCYDVDTRVGQLAAMYSPGNGAMLSSSSVNFQWNSSSTAMAYRLEVGSTQGGNDYYESGSLPTTTLSQTVTGLPVPVFGYNDIYATLWTEINGQWANNQYEYTLGYPPDFTISASPTSLTIRQGQQGTSTITTTVSDNFPLNSSMSLSTSGVPLSTTASFNPNPIPSPGAGRSTLTLSVGSKTSVGTYTITVTGYGGWIQHTTPITLTVVKH